METMKWRIAREKILFIRKMSMREADNFCRQSLIHEFILGIQGLGSEGERLATEAGLLDQRFHQGSKSTINKAISMACRRERRREASRELRDMISDDRGLFEYLKQMPMKDSRTEQEP